MTQFQLCCCIAGLYSNTSAIVIGDS